MKAKLQFEQKETPFGYMDTKLVRIKLTDDNGKYLKFAKHSPEIMAFLQNVEMEIPEDLEKLAVR